MKNACKYAFSNMSIYKSSIYKKVVSAFLCVVILLSSLSLGVLAEEADCDLIDAPGGIVSNGDELIEALGGSEAAGLFGDKIMLKSDILLLDTITIVYGSYIIDGGDCTIKRGFDGGCMISVGKDDIDYFSSGIEAPMLSLGFDNGYSQEESLVIDCKSISSDADQISSLSDAVRVFGTLYIYNGTVIKNSPSYAVYNKGDVEAVGLDIEDCKMPIYNSGKFSMTSCNISGGKAVKGGAVYNQGLFVASECMFKNNLAENGGTIYNAASNSGNTEDKVIFYSSENEFLSSSASENGGCIYNEAEFLESGGRINGSSAKYGGYIYNTGNFEGVKIFAQNCTGQNGGFAYNNGSLVLGASGTVDGCSATENGGGVYNDIEGSLSLNGTMISSSSAIYGGGVFNKGKMTYSSGTLTYNKADIGEAILNDGTLVMTGSPVSNENNDIFIVVDDSNKHAIQISSAITAPYTARLTPGICENGEYKKAYSQGSVLIDGEYAKEKYQSFSISDQGSRLFDWHISSDGALSRTLIYEQIILYIIIAVALIVAVLVVIFAVKKQKAKKNKQTALESPLER